MSSTNQPDESSSIPSGLHVVYGSRTRRGLTHANEDRHAVAIWRSWQTDAHLINAEGSGGEEKSGSNPVPLPVICAPLCVGSARRDTTFFGCGSTGSIVNPFAVRSDLPSDGQSNNATPQPRGSRDENSNNAYLWTVCDGHDGPEAADYVCKHVGESFSRIWHNPSSPKIPLGALKDKKMASGEEAKVYARGFALSNALARTFEALDASFKLHVTPTEPGPDGATNKASCTAGSCVTSIFLTNNLMCCAGLGDCKAAILTLEEADTSAASGGAVQSKSGDVSTTGDEKAGGSATSQSRATQQFQVTWFSKEHRSSSPKERARIRSRGGWFRHGRVGGVLEPTRTIGDFDVKASQPSGVVIATPEVRTFSVVKPALVLVASDGVWDVMDASQLLRTLKKRRRLWRGILSWLGAPMPERRGIMGFGFRRRAKSKEGLEGMLQMPTGGDLCAMADTLVTRAHDLGSDDDCTCVVIYLRPAEMRRGMDASSKRTSETEDMGEADEDLAASSSLPCGAGAEEDEDEEEEEEELEEDDEMEGAEEGKFDASADSAFEYEKWRNPIVGNEDADKDEEDPTAVDHAASKDQDVWDLSTATFPVSLVATQMGMETLFPSSAVDFQDAPEVIEKARKRREERRAARERRKKSTEPPPPPSVGEIPLFTAEGAQNSTKEAKKD